MRKLLLILGLIIHCAVWSQGWIPIGARSSALANSSVTLSDVWAFHHNPGALAEIKFPTVGVSYENRYLLKELQSQGVAYAHPIKYGVISVGAQFYGYKHYRTQRIGVGYSMAFAKRFFAGVQLNYLGMQLAENYGSKNSVSAEVGLQAIILKDWKLGFSITNITHTKLNRYQNERFSTNFRLGMSYLLLDKVLFLIEASKSVVQPVRFSFAVEYNAVKDFFIRAGVGTSPVEFCFGVGYKWKVIALDAGCAYRQQLGWSPSVSLTFVATKKQPN